MREKKKLPWGRDNKSQGTGMGILFAHFVKLDIGEKTGGKESRRRKMRGGTYKI